MNNKEKVMEATISEFNEKGIKFTMDDLAKRLGMSKKTIYALFNDKETLFIETVHYCFDMIKLSEMQIIEDESLDTLVFCNRKIHKSAAILYRGTCNLNLLFS